MVETLDLNRLNHRSCFCGGFCIEEYYLPNLFFLLEKDRFAFEGRASRRRGGGREPAAGRRPLRGHDRRVATGSCGGSSEARSSPSSTARANVSCARRRLGGRRLRVVLLARAHTHEAAASDFSSGSDGRIRCQAAVTARAHRPARAARPRLAMRLALSETEWSFGVRPYRLL